MFFISKSIIQSGFETYLPILRLFASKIPLMTRFVLSIYHFLAAHKVFRWVSLIGSTLIFAILALQLHFEEDITKLLPSTGDENETMAFSQLKVKDKIFLLVTSADEEAPLEPYELAEVIDELTDGIYQADENARLALSQDPSNQDNPDEEPAGLYVADILSEIDEEMMLDVVSYLADNFPIFVDTADYKQFEALLTDSAVNANVLKVKHTLTSQAGIAMKDMLAADPIGMRSVVLSRVTDIREGLGNSQIVYENHLFTPDTTVALAYLSPNFKAFDSMSGRRLVQLIEDEIEKVEANHPEVDILFHGAPIQSVNNSRQIKKDLSLTLVVSLLLVCVGIGICFKNKSTIPMLILPVAYGAIFALAMMYLVRGIMSLMALGIGAIVLGVALSYCLHVITHYKYVSTPQRVLMDQATPVLLGCLTTIGSFLGLLFTSSELLSDFGLFASFGLAGTTFFSLIFLPHFFNPQRNRRSKKAFRVLERFNSHRFEKHKWLIIAIAVVACVCFYTQRWVTFDADLTHISYTAKDVKRSQELLQSKTQPGLVTTYYATSDSSLDAALSKSRLMFSVLDSLKEKGRVRGFSKVAALFPTEEEQEARLDAWTNFWNKDRIALANSLINNACQKNGIAPSFFAPFNDVITSDYDVIDPYADELLPPGLMANIIENTDGQYLVFSSAQMRPDEKKNVGRALVNATNCIVVDPMFYTEEMIKTINNDFNTALNISMAFVFVILLISYRNVVLAIVAFIPMTLSWFIVLGVMGILGLQFNLINIVISTFIFGIGVDYSIFVMDGLLSKAKSQSEPQLLVYHKTAIFFSAVTLVVSTGSLLVASHPALASIGIATIIGMSSAVLLAYTLQPFLYHSLVRLILRMGWKANWLEDKKKK